MTAEEYLDKHFLEEGDLLFARSGATVGKTYLHESDNVPSVFAGYCIRFRFNRALVLPSFVYFITKTLYYERWVLSIQRPSGQPNINKEEFKSLTIPLPSLNVQRELVNKLLEAQNVKRNKVSQADSLQKSSDVFLEQQLNLRKLPEEQIQSVFAIKLSTLHKSRLNPDYYNPERLNTIKIMEQAQDFVPCKKLGELVTFERTQLKSPEGTYVGLAHVQSHTGEIVTANEDVNGTCFTFFEGDVLFGRLRPYLNKVYFAEFSGCCSTEFYVLRVKCEEEILPIYLATILRSKLILAQTKHMMTGNTHPRITNEDITNLMIPIPSIDLQNNIVNLANNRRKESRELRAEAEIGWLDAMKWFEDQLNGGE